MLHMAGDPNDFCRTVGQRISNVLTDRVLSWEYLTGQFFVNDDDKRTVRGILPREGTPAQKWNSHRCEMVRAYGVKVCDPHVAPFRCLRIVFGREPDRRIAQERESANLETRPLHTRKTGQPGVNFMKSGAYGVWAGCVRT